MRTPARTAPSIHPSIPPSPAAQWANALLVVSVEQLLGYDCDAAAQAFHLGYVAVRRLACAPLSLCYPAFICPSAPPPPFLCGPACAALRCAALAPCPTTRLAPPHLPGPLQAREEKDGGSNGDPRMHQTAEAAMQWDGVYKSKVRAALSLARGACDVPWRPSPSCRCLQRRWSLACSLTLCVLYRFSSPTVPEAPHPSHAAQVADWKGIGHLVPIHTEGEAGSIKPVEVEGTT